MIVADRKSPEVKQGGIALLFLVVAIALTISAYYFSKVSIVEIQADNVQKTRLVLKTAKKELFMLFFALKIQKVSKKALELFHFITFLNLLIIY